MKRAVRTVLRIIAVALAVFGAMGAGLEFFRSRLHEDSLGWTQVTGGAVLIAAGAGLFAVSARLAEKLTDDFEE